MAESYKRSGMAAAAAAQKLGSPQEQKYARGVEIL